MSRVSVIMLGADADTTVSDFSTQLQLQTLDGKYFFFVNSEDSLKSSPGLDELYNIAETENAGWVRFGSCESAARIDCRRVIRETDTSDADYYMVFSKEQIPDLLRLQVMSGVRMVQSIRWLRKHGAERVIEIGPGHVLSGFVHRTEPELETVALDTAEDLEAYLSGRADRESLV